MTVTDRVRDAHRHAFSAEPRLFAAPGRVNLIGEHTDYNDGFVLPMAIDRWTIVAASRNDTDAVRIQTLAFDDRIDIPIDEPFRRQSGWVDYAAGVVAAIGEDRALEYGIDVTVGNDLPIGAGLSSSASFELALAQAVLSLCGRDANADRLAAIGRRAEHEYVGIRSGAMDQLAVAHGVANSALFIDCRTLGITPVALPAGVAVAIMDTGIRRSLATSAYNTRREECERGVALLRKAGLDIDALRDVTPEMLESHGAQLPSPIRERVRHVVEENARTKAAVAALAVANVAEVGRLMNESHESLRDLYDVSIPELDALVARAREVDGVYGARMTGAGFGGCAVALIDESAADRVRYHVTNAFITTACTGTHEITDKS